MFGIKRTQTADASGSATSPNPGFAIGDSDSHVFNCPSCARPLADGTSTCPGCGARLIMGVLLRRAGMILALGVVIGLLVGGTVMSAVITVSLREHPAAAAPGAVPVVTPAPAAVRTFTPGIPLAPSGAMAALSATAIVNDRISSDARVLATLLASKAPSASDLARALRALGADAAVGMDLTVRLSPWTAAAPVADQLDAFYGAMSDLTRTGLRASLGDDRAYRDTAVKMLAAVATIDDVDAASRTLAATVELELPPIAQSSAAPAASRAP